MRKGGLAANTTHYAILGLLYHEPLSGYDIRKRIKGSLALFWDAGFGQIYPALRAMESDGLITGCSAGENGRPRKVYTICEKGRAALHRWISEPPARERVHYEILLKLFFGGVVQPGQNIRAIEEFRDRYRGPAAQLEAYERNLRAVLGDSPDHVYYLLTVLFGRHVYRAYLEWADEALALLRSLPASSDSSRKENDDGGVDG